MRTVRMAEYATA